MRLVVAYIYPELRAFRAGDERLQALVAVAPTLGRATDVYIAVMWVVLSAVYGVVGYLVLQILNSPSSLTSLAPQLPLIATRVVIVVLYCAGCGLLAILAVLLFHAFFRARIRRELRSLAADIVSRESADGINGDDALDPEF